MLVLSGYKEIGPQLLQALGVFAEEFENSIDMPQRSSPLQLTDQRGDVRRCSLVEVTSFDTLEVKRATKRVQRWGSLVNSPSIGLGGRFGVDGCSPAKGVGAIAEVGRGRRGFSYDESQGQDDGVILLLGGQAVNEQAVGSLPTRPGGADFERGSGEFAAVGFGDGAGEDKLLGRVNFFGEGLILRGSERGQ
jgi:hypothetical protein